MALRNYSFMLIMLDCGLRASEIVNLRPGDVDLRTGKVKVQQGKGRKDRILWGAQRTLDALRKWIEKEARLEIQSQWLFCTLKGNQLDTSYLRHMLRHSFATDLYRQTNKLVMVQKALGHASITTTTIYTHLVDEELENGMKALRR